MAQSRAFIESWLTTTPFGEDDEDDYQDHDDAQTWEGFIRIARSRVTSARTKQRSAFLWERVLAAVEKGSLDLQQSLAVFQLLILTYPRYADRPSRQAVLSVLKALVAADQAGVGSTDASTSSAGVVTDRIITWLSREMDNVSTRGASSTASSNRFVILTWCAAVFEVCAPLESFRTFPAWSTLLGAFALSLDSLMGDAVRPGMKKAAIVSSRRSIRKTHTAIPVVIKTLSDLALSSLPPAVAITLIGLVLDVASHLRPPQVGSNYISEVKASVLKAYADGIVSSKTPVPRHSSIALKGFIESNVTEVDLTGIILPAAQKGLLRSPDVVLSVMSDFITAYANPVPQAVSQTLLTAIMTNSKSTSAAARSSALSLYGVLTSRDPSLSLAAAKEIISTLQSGKTASPEHRHTLYVLSTQLPTSAEISPAVVQALVPLLPKELNENALRGLAEALSKHLSFCLVNDCRIKPEVMNTLVREMGNQKVLMRRTIFGIIGNALFTTEPGAVSTATAEVFASSIVGGLETALKNVSTNPVNYAAGPLEGYVAVTLALGPLGRSGSKPLGSLLSKNAVLKSILAVTPKLSFVLWDRVYRKATTPEDELWLLRAAEAMLSSHPSEIRKNEQLRSHVGSIFLHLAIESDHYQMRRETVSTVQSCNSRHPQAVNHAIHDALQAYLVQPVKPVHVIGDEEVVKANPKSRLSPLLIACSTFDERTVTDVREELVAEWIILAHHPEITAAAGVSWIELVQTANLDPKALVVRRTERIQQMINNVLLNERQEALKQAATRAATTIAFVAPDAVVPAVLEQIRADLQPFRFKQLTSTDYGIWSTPEGTPFVDVLGSRKQPLADRNRKDYEIDKWESELRQSLAKKAAAKATATPALSKQERALVEAQLVKEASVRGSISALQLAAHRGLALIRSLVAAETTEFRLHLGGMISLLLDGVLPYGARLVGPDAFQTYLELSKAVTDRVGEFRMWIGIATLRSHDDISVVPDELSAEPVADLLTRVLYRLRSLAEQTPFDSATFTYVSPLLNQLVRLGGIRAGTEDTESPLEQLALCLDLTKFHCSVFSDPIYPRLDAIRNLITLISGYSKLLQPALTALVDLGGAVKDNATPEEVQALIRGTLYQGSYVRNACLQALQPVDLTDLDFSAELWLACSDDDEQNSRLARHLWEDNGLDVTEASISALLPFLEHDHAYVRISCANAIAEGVLMFPQVIGTLVHALQGLYLERAQILMPEYDAYGMVIAATMDRADPWPVRAAVALSFERLAESYTEAEVVPFFDFLLNKEALGDRSADVRQAMLNAGAAVIDFHGHTRLSSLIAMFENYLTKRLPPSDTHDNIKEAVVILFGRLARHLNTSDERIPKIVDRLVGALKTPSEVVQSAVAECLPPLVKGTTVDTPALVDRLLDQLVNGSKYAERRGAAYGLAGVIKGRGISGIKDYNLIDRLRTFMEDKKRFEPRQGVLFVFETLSATLGRLFEPYIIQLLPLLLTAYGDASPDVREATQDATRVIMSKITGYGVKLILPSLLSGLDEKQWRTKKGSIEMLGAMAFCAPKQLSISLPTVIPRLTGVLTDSHAQVRAAANTSLKQFGEVISNPEIHSLVPVLLKALVDPATRTPAALRALIDTSFAHYIDSPSLALVIPIIERGLRERGAETKRRAAQIVGNLASLTDPKDFLPHLERLIPLVRTVLVDPVPEARATAAKALGTLVERLGEVNFPDLMPSLLQTLKMDTSGVDRQGAAQGLSEVLSGLGMERLEALLPEVIANARSPRPYVREGFMSLLVYLPATFGVRFAPHIPRIIPPVLGGLSDDEETVREASMRAGRMIIANYSKTAMDLLLPELEHGMFDSGWRIRQSSVTLIGELLFKISGISGKTEIEEEVEGEEGTGVDASRKALVNVLGKERRDRVLAALYIVRQDAVAVVRQSSIHIWKALVHNTPRTVRDILPALINLEISLLAGQGADQRETAARTMGELCRKLGEKILGAIIPILKSGAASENPRTREGVCLALCEIMENTTETQREDHEDGIIAAVRDSLVDESPTVRAAAAQAFDVLQERIGPKAIDQTIPTLLQALRQPGESAQTALQALREVMAVRATTVLPALLPTLLATPMTAFNARALKSLVSVAGRALSRRLNQILGSLVKALETEKDPDLRAEIEDAVDALLGAIVDPEGLNTCMMLLLGWSKNEAPTRRASGALFFSKFCKVSELDFSDYRVDWIRQLVGMLDDRQGEVVEAASGALETLVKTTDKEDLEALVVPMRRTIESTGAPGRSVPGFCQSKGIAPLVPIILAGLTGGTNEQKEQAAYAIGDIVQRASEPAIKPYVVQLTGPLIRVITQATTFPPQVKSAILSSLTGMLTTIPAFVKPFFPQLQRTFIKSSSDPASLAVRNRAGAALGVLMGLQTRVDPVVTELIGGARTGEPEIRSSMAVALAAVVKSAGKAVGEVARSSIYDLVSDAFSEGGSEPYNTAIADVFSGLALHDAALVKPLIDAHLTANTPPTPLSSLSIVSFLTNAPDAFYTLGVVPSIVRKTLVSVHVDQPAISRPAREARDLLKTVPPYVDDDSVQAAI